MTVIVVISLSFCLSVCLSVCVNDISERTPFPHWKQAPSVSMLCFIGFKFAIILKTVPVSEIKASQNWPVKLLLSVGMPLMGA